VSACCLIITDYLLNRAICVLACYLIITDYLFNAGRMCLSLLFDLHGIFFQYSLKISLHFVQYTLEISPPALVINILEVSRFAVCSALDVSVFPLPHTQVTECVCSVCQY